MTRSIAIAAFLLFVPSLAFAQQVTPAQAGGILTALQDAIQQWNGPLTTIAEELFGGLALIGFVLTVGMVLMQGGSLIDLLAALLRQIILLGFWSAILEGWPTFGHAIVASFQQAAQQAGGIPMSPGDVMSVGVNIGMRIMDMAPWYDVTSKMFLVIPASFAAVAFFIVAGLMILSLAKAYMAIGLGTLLLGFAGSNFTDHIARNVIGMTIAIGARLFTIQMMAGLGATIIRAWVGDATALDGNGMWSIIGLSVVYAITVFGVPAMAEHMAGGGGHGHVGPGMLVRAISSTMAAVSSSGRAAMASYGALAAADNKIASMLPSSGGTTSLPPSGGTGGSGGAAPAGARMRPPGFTVKN